MARRGTKEYRWRWNAAAQALTDAAEKVKVVQDDTCDDGYITTLGEVLACLSSLGAFMATVEPPGTKERPVEPVGAAVRQVVRDEDTLNYKIFK